MKKQKKKLNICEFYLSKFIAGIPPNEFLKILRGIHDVLEIVGGLDLKLLRLKKDANKNSKLYNFYKQKDGVQIKCICEYYRLLLNGDTEEKNINCKITTTTDCIKVKKFFNIAGDIFDCTYCHKEMYTQCGDGLVELKTKGN